MCKCSWFRAKNIDQRCISYKLKRKQFNRKYIFFFWRKVYVLWIQQSKKKVHVTILFFIQTFLYSIWAHVEISKCIMICLRSPQSTFNKPAAQKMRFHRNVHTSVFLPQKISAIMNIQDNLHIWSKHLWMFEASAPNSVEVWHRQDIFQVVCCK